MNTENSPNCAVRAEQSLAQRCLVTCQKIVAQIEKTKNNILAEFREQIGASEQLLRLALTEAEGLAWETSYPQLFFPTLALEKAQGVVAWDAHQRSIRQGDFPRRLEAAPALVIH